MPAAVSAVTAALYGFPILLIPDHASYRKPHKGTYHCPYNKSSHTESTSVCTFCFFSCSYLAGAIPFMLTFKVLLSL